MSNCCTNCFDDQYVISLITQANQRGHCDYCGSYDSYIMDISLLTDTFEPLMQIYQVTAPGQHYDPHDQDAWPGDYGDFLNDLIQQDWSVFSDKIDSKIQLDLLFDILHCNLDYENHFDKDSFYSKIEWNFGYSDSTSYWNQFSNKLKHRNRYFIEEDWAKQLSPLLARYSEVFQMNGVLFRARIGAETKKFRKVTGPLPPNKMGAPPPDKSKNGRANPAGISYLYTATNERTAIAEVRPWLQSKVTVAELRALENLKIVNLSKIAYMDTPFGIPNLLEEIEGRNFLQELSHMLSKPIEPDMSDIDYVPTQFLSELIKYLKYDGIRFKSSFGSGDNIVIFDQGKTEIVTSKLFLVRGMSIDFESLDT